MVTKETVIDFAEIMKSYGLTKLELKDDEKHIVLETGTSVKKADEKIKIEKKPVIEERMTEEKKVSGKDGYIQKSIVVGTVYLSPAEGMETFVKAGDRVNEGDVLCIVESMKMFNEVTSETSGVIKEVLISNGQIIEYGQPLFVIDTEEGN